MCNLHYAETCIPCLPRHLCLLPCLLLNPLYAYLHPPSLKPSRRATSSCVIAGTDITPLASVLPFPCHASAIVFQSVILPLWLSRRLATYKYVVLITSRPAENAEAALREGGSWNRNIMLFPLTSYYLCDAVRVSSRLFIYTTISDWL